ncbi:MAG TPA: hypothetical protein VFR32_05480 [Gaiellaceae bacterium]|nr:hypothetical protein [Gaiellaceae bacterium]
MRRRLLALVACAAGAFALAAAAMPGAGTIATIAGTGAGATGAGVDGLGATASPIDHPRGLAIGRNGMLVAEPFRHTVRLVVKDVVRVAGTGERGYSGDGGPATAAQLDGVHGVAFMPDGGFVLADTGNHRIRRVWPDGTITTVAGTGVPGYAGDGGPALAAGLEAPRGIASLPDGGILFPDTGNDRIRRIWPDGTITTVAGSGIRGFGGDGGQATAAQLQLPFGVSPVTAGGFLIADTGNQRIRRVSPDGRITTVAGGDGSLSSPHAVAAVSDGGFLVADTGNNRIRRVYPDGTVRTVAGTGQAGYSGDGGNAVLARLSQPKALAVISDENGYLIGDSANNRVRLVSERLTGALVVKIPARVRSRTGVAAVLPVVLSERASLRLDVTRAGKRVLRVRSTKPKGSSKLVFGRTLARGTYALRLFATASDGERVTRSSTLVRR